MRREKNLLLPDGYKSFLTVRETEKAIKRIKDHFERELASFLNLERVSAPLFVMPKSGLNDNLNGIERPVAFDISGINGEIVEVVHSLAKWKRLALEKYGFMTGEGLYTDMDAIRRDEELDNLHSIYVDQWDWELVIDKCDRTIDKLKDIVKRIYKALRSTEEYVSEMYPGAGRLLPKEISFITSQELEDKYPHLSPKERENAETRDKGALFVMQIGKTLKSGKKHDGRAPDYDDWDLNGDILVWYPLLEIAMELSSMGIRVDEEALQKQLESSGCLDRKELEFHKLLLEGKLPYTAGGGIGQSRLCMYLLRKAHVGEVQASVWPEEMIEQCSKASIELL
ncbi:MAG: aspartate--ammonia ligase [Eubacteriales bacterium]|nr:aspartate--ammonia ligase [Eubacteriales bacterium]